MKGNQVKTIDIQIQCIQCKKIHTITVDSLKYESWMEGLEHIQDAFPMLSVDDRELMISKICGKCYDNLFAGPEYD
jgi:hypothetical protein